MSELAYLGAGVLFILGLKGLTSPRTARRGNQLAAVGMLFLGYAEDYQFSFVYPLFRHFIPDRHGLATAASP